MMYNIEQSHTSPILTDGAKVDFIATRFREIMEALGLDLSNPSLADSPQRVAESYVHELFSGLNPDNFPRITYFACDDEPQTVVVRDISVHSMCEHHFLPITGHADIAYIPKDRLIGLSKFNRVVDHFCRRPQLQERLTIQIADSFSELLDTDDVAVRIRASHGCVCGRGVRDHLSTTTTQVIRGTLDSVIFSSLAESCCH